MGRVQFGIGGVNPRRVTGVRTRGLADRRATGSRGYSRHGPTAWSWRLARTCAIDACRGVPGRPRGWRGQRCREGSAGAVRCCTVQTTCNRPSLMPTIRKKAWSFAASPPRHQLARSAFAAFASSTSRTSANHAIWRTCRRAAARTRTRSSATRVTTERVHLRVGLFECAVARGASRLPRRADR